jgi:GT2 family glycosyltransferase
MRSSIQALHPATPDVYCVVVNWNGWADTRACLVALTQQDYPSLHVIVVDNGSTDSSADCIRSAFPQMTLLRTGRNLGFATGTNVGLRHALAAGADLLWLLNNDTIAPPDTCSKLVARALAEPSAGIIGSVLYFTHAPTQVQAWGGGNVNAFLGRSSHFHAPAPIGPTTYLTFASVLIPRKVALEVGILYEGFFMYWDDTDLALRVTRAGYTLAIATDTAILHKEGGSSAPRSPLIDRYSAASGLHFLRRQSPAPLLSMSIFLTTRLVRRALQRRWQNFQAVWLAIGDYRRQRHTPYTDQP